MNNLIIITGLSGTGKSTISKQLNEEFENSTLIQVDTIKENIYDIVGYKNKKQKEELKTIIFSTFLSLLENSMQRKDKNIIIEYPFSIRWEKIFLELIEKYKYRAITIKTYGKDFDTVYKRVEKRDNSSARHVTHSLNQYDPKQKEKYISECVLGYQELKELYEKEIYTDISIGTTINHRDDDFNNLLQKIKQEIYRNNNCD